MHGRLGGAASRAAVPSQVPQPTARAGSGGEIMWGLIIMMRWPATTCVSTNCSTGCAMCCTCRWCARAGLERCQLPPLLPCLARRWQHARCHGRAAREGRHRSLPRVSRHCWSSAACTCRVWRPAILPPDSCCWRISGTVLYLARLEAGADADALYADALEALLRIQIDGRTAARSLAAYDRAALARELALMPEWFCARHLRLGLDRRGAGAAREHLRVPDRARHWRSRWCSCIATTTRAT